MDIIGIKDNGRLLRFACDDLRAVRSAAQLAVYHEECDSDDMLRVIDQALGSIIVDIEEAVGKIENCLGDEGSHKCTEPIK